MELQKSHIVGFILFISVIIIGWLCYLTFFSKDLLGDKTVNGDTLNIQQHIPKIDNQTRNDQTRSGVKADTSHIDNQIIPMKMYDDGLNNFKSDTINITSSTFPYSPVKIPITMPLRLIDPNMINAHINLMEIDSVLTITGTLKELLLQFLDEHKIPHEYISIHDDKLNVNSNVILNSMFKDSNEKTITLKYLTEPDKSTSLVVEVGETIQQKIFNFNTHSRTFLYIDGKIKNIDISDINTRL